MYLNADKPALYTRSYARHRLYLDVVLRLNTAQVYATTKLSCSVSKKRHCLDALDLACGYRKD